MTPKFLFQDSDSGLWLVDDATGGAANLSNLANNAKKGGIAGVNGEVLFATTNQIGQLNGSVTGAANKLWLTAGTAGTTQLVVTLRDKSVPGPPDIAQINDLTTLPSGLVFFDYYDGINFTVYLTNGTASGTQLISEFTGNSNVTVRPYIRDGVVEISGHVVFSDLSGDWSVNE